MMKNRLKHQDNHDCCSVCCGADYEDVEDYHICLDCGEECEVTTVAEFEYDEYLSAMEDKADAERDER